MAVPLDGGAEEQDIIQNTGSYLQLDKQNGVSPLSHLTVGGRQPIITDPSVKHILSHGQVKKLEGTL